MAAWISISVFFRMWNAPTAATTAMDDRRVTARKPGLQGLSTNCSPLAPEFGALLVHSWAILGCVGMLELGRSDDKNICMGQGQDMSREHARSHSDILRRSTYITIR